MYKNIKASLNNAMNELPCASFEYIANAPVQKADAYDIAVYNELMPTKRHAIGLPLRRLAMAAACCALLLVAGLGVFSNIAVRSVITIDVNPSFEITANSYNRVLDITPMNEDAQQVLEGKTYKGEAVDVAVEALFAQMAKSKYMNAQKNTVLLSVTKKGSAHGKQMEKSLREHITKAMEATAIKPNIIIQELADTKEKGIAAQYHVSAGKLQLAQKVNAQLTEYTVEKLAALPLEQLISLAEGTDVKRELDMDDDDDDDDDDKIATASQHKPASKPAHSKNDSSKDKNDDDDDDDNDDDDDKTAATGKKPVPDTHTNTVKPSPKDDADDTDDTDEADDKKDKPASSSTTGGTHSNGTGSTTNSEAQSEEEEPEDKDDTASDKEDKDKDSIISGGNSQSGSESDSRNESESDRSDSREDKDEDVADKNDESDINSDLEETENTDSADELQEAD